MQSNPAHILFMGTYPPRECGIATFTRDLATSIDKEFNPLIKSKILAINNDKTNVYNYSNEVIYQINENDIGDYIEIAKKINRNPAIKLISIQHEFGIFGGEYGSYLIAFLEVIEKQVMITFHSVLPNPNPKLKKIVQLLAQNSISLVVMTNKAIEILRNDYEIKTDIKVIPHGIPNVQFSSNKYEKKNLGYEDKILLSSFGMISESKGYEYVIDSLVKVVKKFPNILYLIVGETHPVVRKNEGEKYRNFLENKVRELGLQNNVKFYNKYMTLDEILQYLRASDIYISPSLSPNQITSGTLVYAMGSGRAVISTPFLHAQDILNQNRGILLEKFKDSECITNAILKLVSNPEYSVFCGKNSYAYTRHMTWSNVAIAYKRKFSEILNMSQTPLKFPRINLNHLINMTDNFGLIQFAEYTKPDIESGYTLDDNARALIAICMHNNLSKSKERMNLVKTYLGYIEHVYDNENGKLFNYVNKHKFIDKENFSNDAHGRALWALGYFISCKSAPPELKEKAIRIFEKALEIGHTIDSPRTIAFMIIGMYFYNKQHPSKENINKISKFADDLVYLYQNSKSNEWKWFEEYLTYSNSKLPEALLYAYLATNNQQYLKIAKTTLDFLISITFENDMFCPIGQNGWHLKDKQRSYFDQQPVDAASMIQTLILAGNILKNKDYLEKSHLAFHWFLGKNHLNQVIYDESTGGCYDGLGKHSINLNQGAESTISYLLARLALENQYLNICDI